MSKQSRTNSSRFEGVRIFCLVGMLPKNMPCWHREVVNVVRKQNAAFARYRVSRTHLDLQEDAHEVIKWSPARLE